MSCFLQLSFGEWFGVQVSFFFRQISMALWLECEPENRRYIMINHLLKKRAAFPEISPVGGVLYSNGSRNPNCCN